jgi:hypothetical protein
MATDILCRFDRAKNAAVVFLSDTINGNQIQAWDGHGNPKYVPLDYYHMTAPLSAADEKVLMERFKQATNRNDQVLRIRQRLPRTPRHLPNILASSAPGALVSAPAPATPRKSAAKAIEHQPAPPAAQGNLPQPGETLAPIPQAPVKPELPADVAGELPSVGLFRRIETLNKFIMAQQQHIALLDAEVQKATTDRDAAQKAIAELTVEFEKAIKQEAADAVAKSKAMLQAVKASADPVAQFAQHLEQAGAQPIAPAQQQPAAKAPTGGKQRGTGGRFQKAPAPTK